MDAAVMTVNPQLSACMAQLPEAAALRRFLSEQAVPPFALDDLQMVRGRIERRNFNGLRLLYKGALRDGASRGIYFFARSEPRLQGHSVAAEINAAARRSTSAGPATERRAALYAEPLRLLIQFFPSDAGLPQLARIADTEFLKRLFEGTLGNFSRGRALTGVDAALVRYEPEKKCLFRYRLSWRDPKSGDRQTETVYGKVFGKAQRAHEDLARIHERAKAQDFRVPEPIAVVAELSWQIFGELEGMPLPQRLNHASFADDCRRIGAALRQFHEMPVAFSTAKPMARQLTESRKWTEEFAWALPAAAERIRRLYQKIERVLANQSTHAAKPVHGDFNPANVLVAAENVGFIDFDDCFMGQPELDVGSFYGELKLLALKEFGDSRRFDAGLRAFLSAYFGDNDSGVSEVTAAWCALNCLWCGYFQALLRPTSAGFVERAVAMIEHGEDVFQRGALS